MTSSLKGNSNNKTENEKKEQDIKILIKDNDTEQNDSNDGRSLLFISVVFGLGATIFFVLGAYDIKTYSYSARVLPWQNLVVGLLFSVITLIFTVKYRVFYKNRCDR